jgi:hypothetical protein
MALESDKHSKSQAKGWQDIAAMSGAIPPESSQEFSSLSDSQKLKALIDFYRQEFSVPEKQFPHVAGPVEKSPKEQNAPLGYMMPTGEIFVHPQGYEGMAATLVHELLHGRDIREKRPVKYPEQHFSFAEKGTPKQSSDLAEIAVYQLIDKMREEASKREKSLLERLTGQPGRSEAYELMYPPVKK